MINSSGINGAAVNGGLEAGGPLDVRDSAVILGTHNIGLIEDVTETAELRGSAWAYPYYADVRETAVITGDYAPPLIRALTVRDSAAITNTHDIVRTTFPTVRDPALVFDTPYVLRSVHLDVTETAVVLGDAEDTSPALDLRDAALVTSTASYVLTARYTVSESARITSQPYLGGSLAVRDSFVATDTATPVRIARYVVRDVGVITGIDADDIPQDTGLDVRDTAVVLGYASSILTARLDVHEDGYISDALVSADGLVGSDGLPVDSVWTASVASWGMSRHTGVGITQRGSRFAVSPSGLYEIGTSYSAAQIETGFMGLGSKALKHVSTVYLQGERDGDITVDVTADHRGVRATNSYLPHGREQTDSRSIRFDLGRGYRSTYFKLQIATTGRVEVFGGGALVATTERRI